MVTFSMRLGRPGDTVVSLYLHFVFFCLCARLVDVSRSLFCVESVLIQSEAPKSVAALKLLTISGSLLIALVNP
ncbi:hypothetical protein EDB83DRAFT_1091538 [Lactarius deliciosus]|nr:hypothetical protein EDB83DRAFT_1091538 [Lactarius deliciosus]